MQVIVAEVPKDVPFFPPLIKCTPPFSINMGQTFSTHNPLIHICSPFSYPGQSLCKLQNREHLGSGIPALKDPAFSVVTQIDVPFPKIE